MGLPFSEIETVRIVKNNIATELNALKDKNGNYLWTKAYNLSISQGSNTTITVTRTACAVSGRGSTGALSNGSIIYVGDTLKITAGNNEHYNSTQITCKNNEVSVALTDNTTKTITVDGNVSVSTSNAILDTHTITYKIQYYAITGLQSVASTYTVETVKTQTVSWGNTYSNTVSKDGYGSASIPETTCTGDFTHILTLTAVKYQLKSLPTNGTAGFYSSDSYTNEVSWGYSGNTAYFKFTPIQGYDYTVDGTRYYSEKSYTAKITISTEHVTTTCQASKFNYSVSGSVSNGSVSWSGTAQIGNTLTWTITPNTHYNAPSPSTGTLALNSTNFTLDDSNKTASAKNSLGTCTLKSYTITYKIQYYAITGLQSVASTYTTEEVATESVQYGSSYSKTVSKTGYGSATLSGTCTGDVTKTATLTAIKYNVSSSLTNGTGGYYTSNNYSTIATWGYERQTLYFKFTPNIGYDYTVGSTRYYNGKSYTESQDILGGDVTRNISASKFTYLILGSSVSNGSVSWSGTAQIGNTLTWTINANTGYNLPSPSTGTLVLNSTNFTLSEANKTASAKNSLGTCTLKTYTVSLTSSNDVNVTVSVTSSPYGGSSATWSQTVKNTTFSRSFYYGDTISISCSNGTSSSYVNWFTLDGSILSDELPLTYTSRTSNLSLGTFSASRNYGSTRLSCNGYLYGLSALSIVAAGQTANISLSGYTSGTSYSNIYKYSQTSVPVGQSVKINFTLRSGYKVTIAGTTYESSGTVTLTPSSINSNSYTLNVQGIAKTINLSKNSGAAIYRSSSSSGSYSSYSSSDTSVTLYPYSTTYYYRAQVGSYYGPNQAITYNSSTSIYLAGYKPSDYCTTLKYNDTYTGNSYLLNSSYYFTYAGSTNYLYEPKYKGDLYYGVRSYSISANTTGDFLFYTEGYFASLIVTVFDSSNNEIITYRRYDYVEGDDADLYYYDSTRLYYGTSYSTYYALISLSNDDTDRIYTCPISSVSINKSPSVAYLTEPYSAPSGLMHCPWFTSSDYSSNTSSIIYVPYGSYSTTISVSTFSFNTYDYVTVTYPSSSSTNNTSTIYPGSTYKHVNVSNTYLNRSGKTIYINGGYSDSGGDSGPSGT